MPYDPRRNLILSIVAENENSVLESTSIGHGQLFNDLGYHHKTINMFSPGGSTELFQYLSSGEVAFGFAFAGVGSQLKLTNGINIWTASRTPFVSLWYDHPSYNYRQHIVDSPFVINAYHVADHIEVRQKYLPPSSSRCLLLPLSGQMYYNHSQPLRTRLRHILYVKTAHQPEKITENWRRHSALLQEILWTLADTAQKNRNLDLCDAAAVLFSKHALPIDNYDMFMGVVQEVDHYIRAWRSDRLARALLPHPAHIIGRGWDYLKDKTRGAEFFPPFECNNIKGKWGEYKVIANTNPLWRDGVHERVMLGISLGTLVLTDRSIKSDILFKSLPNYCGFEWNDNLSDVIADTLRLSDRTEVDYYDEALKNFANHDVKGAQNYIRAIESAVMELAAALL